MTFRCANCERAFHNADRLPLHNCRRTTRKQTESNTGRVSDERWAQVTARFQHPSSTYTPDGAA